MSISNKATTKKLNIKKDFKYLDVSEDTVFVDRLGNILEKGSIVGYAATGEIKIGVLVGPAQHVRTKWVYKPPAANNSSYSTGHYGGYPYYGRNYVRELSLHQDLVFLTLNKKNKEVKHYLKYEEDKINKYNKLCLIQKPTFYADDRDVVGALMIVDDLVEKGIIKSEKETHQFLDSNKIESHDSLFDSEEDAETEEIEKPDEDLPNDT